MNPERNEISTGRQRNTNNYFENISNILKFVSY